MPSVLLRPEYRPMEVDDRADDVPAIREKIFALLHENIEGMTSARINMTLKESIGLIDLLLTDAYLEGELVRITREVEAEPIGFVATFAMTDEYVYRLSPQKWAEMESND